MATFDESFVGRIPARVALSAIQMSTAGLDHCPRGGLSGQIAVRFLAWSERRHTARASDEMDSFAEWPARRELTICDVVHYLSMTEFLLAHEDENWIHTNLTLVVKSRIPKALCVARRTP